MKFLFIVVISVFISACSSDGSETSQGVFSPQLNIEISDIEGFWVNACIESEELEDVYTWKFLDYKSGNIVGSENQMSFGNQYFSDANCTQAPLINNNLTDVVYTPSFEGEGSDFQPIGLYTSSEGIEAKVVEFNSGNLQSTRLAYYIDGEILYFSYEENSNYTIDYSNPYRLTE